MSETSSSERETWPKKLYGHILSGIISAGIFTAYQEDLKDRFGKHGGVIILLIGFLFLAHAIWPLIKKVINKLVIEPAKARLEALIKQRGEEVIRELKSEIGEDVEKKLDAIELPNQKIERLRDKYKGVNFTPISLSKDYESGDECREVKIELIRGVQRSVHAIHLIEKSLPLPLESNDDEQYFEGNIKALERTLHNHSEDKSDADDDDAYGIHRIFIISQDALDEHPKKNEIPDRIKRHADRFNVLVVKKEELKSPPSYEFAIYDNDIAFYLSVDLNNGVYGEGTIYLDDAVIQGVYKKRFRTIKGLACSPDKFWSKPENTIIP